MKSIKVSSGAGSVLLLLVLALIVMASLVGSAQPDPFDGTWTLNVAKSKYNPGPPPKNQTVTYAAAGKGVKVSGKLVSADGKTITTEYTANYDGNDYPVKGNPDWDAIALKRVNAQTVEFTRKRNGKVVQTGTNTVSKDGKTRTIATKGTNASGQKIDNVAVFEKQ